MLCSWCIGMSVQRQYIRFERLISRISCTLQTILMNDQMFSCREIAIMLNAIFKDEQHTSIDMVYRCGVYAWCICMVYSKFAWSLCTFPI